MPSRQEELEIALRDSITPGLKAIARELRALNQAAKESAQGTSSEIDRVTRSTQTLQQSARAALVQIQNMMTSIVNYGKAIVGVGGAVESFNMLTRSLNDLAMTRVQLNMLSQDTRMSVSNIQQFTGALTRMGYSADEAKGLLTGLTDQLQELQALREGSSLFRELQLFGSGGTKLAYDLMAEKDPKKQLELITNVIRTQEPNVQSQLAKTFKLPQSILLNLDEYLKKVTHVAQVPQEVAQKYLDQTIRMSEQANNEWTLFGAHAMERINAWFDKLNTAGKESESGHAISGFFIREFDLIGKKVQETITEIQYYWDLLKQIQAWADKWADYWQPKAAEERPVTGQKRLEGAFKVLPEGRAWLSPEEMRLTEDNNKILESIKNTLQLAETGVGGGGVGIRGGGLGAGGRPASEGDVAGPFQARGGGFRPTRGSKLESSIAALQARSFGTLAEQRAPYLKYLNDHPELKAKLAGLLVSEEPSREGRVGTAETFLNRMIANGVPPEQMGTSIAGLASGSNVYYQPFRPGGSYERSAAQLAADPELMKRTLEDIDKAASGSNVSNLGTQNASAGVAANAQTNQTVTRGAVPGVSDQWSRKDVAPQVHGPGTVARERDWYEKTSKAMRDNIDADAAAKRGGSVFEKGAAAVSVDFGNLKQRANEAKEDGGVFKPLNNQREPQAPKSGGESGANFNDRWHFQ